MSSSGNADQEGTGATASDANGGVSDMTATDIAVVDQAANRTESDLDEEKPRGPIRKAFGIVATVFWSLIILVAVVFVWPPTWGGPITVTVVQGQSMEPLYYTGDVVIAVRNYSNEYAVGDIIVYKATYGDVEGMVIHRIIKQLPNGNYLTQGDNKEMPDPWEIIPSNIFGKAVLDFPGVAKWLGLVRTPIFIGIIAGGIVIWVLWPRSTEDDEEEDHEDDGQSDGDENNDHKDNEDSSEENNEHKERGPNP
ncbi:MAG: signal peptidase I [Candidatus Nanopelagicales bacterium]